jgi:thiol-disulfide isomerase/thioredoxin
MEGSQARQPIGRHARHLGLLTLILSLLALGGCRKGDSPGSSGLVGQPEPNWSYTTPEGKPIASADFKGRTHMVVFWATWCGPCRQEVDELKAIRTQFAKDSLEIVGLSVDESVSAVPVSVHELQIDYPVAVGAFPLFDSLHFDGIPRSYLVDSKGIVREEFDGLTDRDQLAAAVARALK